MSFSRVSGKGRGWLGVVARGDSEGGDVTLDRRGFVRTFDGTSVRN